MGNQPGQPGKDAGGDEFDEFEKRDKSPDSGTPKSRKSKKDKKEGKSPKSRRSKTAGPTAETSISMGVDLDDDLDDFSEDTRARSGSSSAISGANPFAAPIASAAAREKVSQKAKANAVSNDNPFAKPGWGGGSAAAAEDDSDDLDDFAAPAFAGSMGGGAPETKQERHKKEKPKEKKKDKPKDGGSFSKSKSSKKKVVDESDEEDDAGNPVAQEKVEKVEDHELIAQAVQALGGESLWVCIAKRGIAFRMSTAFEDKENDVDGMEYGDICAVSDVVEGEDDIDYIKLATGDSDITYYVPTEHNDLPLMMKLTCEDAVHGETTSIFRVDKDEGVKFRSVPLYEKRLEEGLDDNHVLTVRIVMVGEMGHRFAFDPWHSLWVPERTARGSVTLYALNLMKDNVREVYRVQAAQGIAFRGSPRFHEKLPGDDGLDKGDVVAVCALMKSMSRPHDVWFALVANSVRWVPLTSVDGIELMKKIDFARSEFVFQVKEQGATLFESPDFGEPLPQSQCLEPHKIVTCCAKVAGPTEGIDFYLLTNGTQWVSNEDQNGEMQIERTKMIAHPFMYQVTMGMSEAKYYSLPATNQPATVTTKLEEGDLVAARLRVEDNGVLFVLCAKTMNWLPICTIQDNGPGVTYLEPTKQRGTTCELRIEKLGLKDASSGFGYTNPFIQVSLVDKDGGFEEEYETPYATRVNDRHMYFLSTVNMEQPVELMQETDDGAIYFEFKHYKKDKHMVSTKCYSFMTTRELRNYFDEATRSGEDCVPLRMHIYRSEKPTDYARKWPPVRLSVKELYMHVSLSFKKYVKKSKK